MIDKKDEIIMDDRVIEVRAKWYVSAGAYHESREECCQDTVLCKEDADILFYGIADGQSGKVYCNIGGEEVLKCIYQYIKKKAIEGIIQYEYKDEIQYEILRIIRDRIAELSKEYSADIGEFSSTIIVLAVNPKTGNYMILHIGDGGIMAKRIDQNIEIISKPENGITKQYTWSTTNSELLAHIRIGFGNVKYYSRIIMFSDGADVICNGNNIPGKTKKFLDEKVEAVVLLDYIKGSGHIDDASCVIIDIVNIM